MANSDDGSSASSGEGDEYYYTRWLRDVWSGVRANNPSTTSVELSWEEEITTSIEVHLYDRMNHAPHLKWDTQGRYIASSTSVRQLTLRGVTDDVANNDKKINMFHCLRGLAQNRSIERLTLKECHFGGGDAGWLTSVWPFFENNANLRILEFVGCTAADDGASSIVERTMAKVNSSAMEQFVFVGHYRHMLQSWRMRLCNDALGGNLIALLRGARHLETLTLNATHVYERTLSALVDMLQGPECNVRTLSLVKSGVIVDWLARVAGVLNKNHKLTALYLEDNKSVTRNPGSPERHACPTTEEWRAFFATIESFPLSLSVLCLRETHIDDKAMAELGRALANGNVLQVLDIQHNYPCLDEGMLVVQNLLSTTNTLRVLNLREARFDDDSAAALAGGLARNATLQELCLTYHSGMSPPGWVRFFNVMGQTTNSMLEHLNVERNCIDDDGVEALLRALRNASCQLKTLSIGDNWQITHAGNRVLSSLLRPRDSTLEKLDLNGNYIGDETLISFADALTRNKVMSTLIVAGHRMANKCTATERGWAALSRALCDRSSIEATFSSNHVLSQIGDKDFNFITGDLDPLLKENRNNTPEDSARLKILRCHILAEDGPNIDAFIGMKCNVMSRAIAWAGRDDEGFRVLYQILRSMPSLLRMNAEGACTGLKRKRSEERVG